MQNTDAGGGGNMEDGLPTLSPAMWFPKNMGHCEGRMLDQMDFCCYKAGFSYVLIKKCDPSVYSLKL